MVKIRVLKLNTWTFSECITNASRYERNAYYWANRVNDYQYQQRWNMSPESCEYQLSLACASASMWYERAAKEGK